MEDENNNLIDIEKLYKEFNKNCTKIGLINQLGFLYRHINTIENILIMVLPFIYVFVFDFFANVEYSLGNIVKYFVVTIFLVFLTFIILIGGEKFLIWKVKKEYKMKNIDTSKCLKNNIRIPSVSVTLENKIRENQKEFIKKYFKGYSKNQIISLYRFTNDLSNNMTSKISESSQVGIFVSFLVVILTIFLTDIFQKTRVEIKSLGALIFIDISIIILLYIFYTIVIWAYGLFEKKFLLGYLRKEDEQLNEFLIFLRKIIINYDFYLKDTKNLSSTSQLEKHKDNFLCGCLKEYIKKLKIK